jgi:hypothetical protein
MDGRKIRGMEIANTIGNRSAKAVSIKRLNKLAYQVRSQTNQNQWYNVINTYDDGWICECLDFQARHQNCKHIHAVHFSKLLRKKITKIQFYNHYRNYKPKKSIQTLLNSDKLSVRNVLVKPIRSSAYAITNMEICNAMSAKPVTTDS